MQEHREITKKAHAKKSQITSVRTESLGTKLQILGFTPFPSFIAIVVFNPPSTRVVGTHEHLVGG